MKIGETCTRPFRERFVSSSTSNTFFEILILIVATVKVEHAAEPVSEGLHQEEHVSSISVFSYIVCCG